MLFIFLLGCNHKPKTDPSESTILNYSKNILDFKGSPENPRSRDMLMFSDQGGWFAYGFPTTKNHKLGFTGPFLMTQQNGVWSGNSLAELEITLPNGSYWNPDKKSQDSYASHLEQQFKDESLSVSQKLVYLSPHTALQQTVITNVSQKPLTIALQYSGKLFPIGAKLINRDGDIALTSEHTNAVGHIQFLKSKTELKALDSLNYTTIKQSFKLAPNASQELLMAQTFIFPEYDWKKEKEFIEEVDFNTLLQNRIREKEQQLTNLLQNADAKFTDSIYAQVLAKTLVTLQNNWRVPAGELKHQGLFPSYHYEWFHGFWSWDSWKHAVGLSFFNTDLAKEQIKAMYDFQLEDGFIIDCVYRDTTIEPHNLRDTKPPLSAWAVHKVFEKDPDMAFLKEMYPKLKKYHQWWYNKRDHDQDGICEYGSTDGTALAAKWESGMDNAIRFDSTQIVKNEEGAFSMDQESVDLNAYLYAEKIYLAELAKAIGKPSDHETYLAEAEMLKSKIQSQFYNTEDGWFYDTDLSGKNFIKGAGSEGWIPLWAKVATQAQATTIKNKMMDPEKFYVKVPFQTMSKDHPKFDPMNGYWRGPNWLDQSYFGVKGLKNYGFEAEAHKATLQILEGAEGVMEKGISIRENYHPLTGKGLYAKNFSWSAAHIIMLLMKE
ncbi:MAG: trehalase [Algicola sp.]|nr:trehalase [Algicola sp.]